MLPLSVGRGVGGAGSADKRIASSLPSPSHERGFASKAGTPNPLPLGERISDDAAEDFQPHLRLARAHHLDLACGLERHVDDAAANERSAVVDADDHAHPVGLVGDSQARAHRQAAMRGGQRPGIEALAAGGAVAGELVPIIACLAFADRFVGVDEDRVAELRHDRVEAGERPLLIARRSRRQRRVERNGPGRSGTGQRNQSYRCNPMHAAPAQPCDHVEKAPGLR
jgi:hypothetical protein